MSGGKYKRSRIDESRDAGNFVALPWSVLDSDAFQKLSHPARSLLLELARQYKKNNNGQLITTLAYLKTRGWTSSDTINRAKQELLNAGLIHETFKGHRPNKASWFAMTFHALYRNPRFDEGAYETFKRGAYQNKSLFSPPGRATTPFNAPLKGAGTLCLSPSGGLIKYSLESQSAPSGEHHLEIPSESDQ